MEMRKIITGNMIIENGKYSNNNNQTIKQRQTNNLKRNK